MRLSVEHGSFFYEKDRMIFEDINFSVDSGEILAILGPNGAGKTTMLRCITGMLKWKKGKSMLDGENIADMPSKKQWSRMAYVPQAKGVTSAYTAFEMVLLGRSSHLNPFSAPGRKDIRKAEEVMELLGITYLAEKKCSKMSGGELQMVLIAKALAAEPKVLILDEPESNLDFKNQLVVLDAMSGLAQKGMTCIFNTHYPAHALQRAHKALILSKGGDYVFGDTASVVNEENIQKAFGVQAVIGEIETKENIVKDVIPLSITPAERIIADGNDHKIQKNSENERAIAAITIIAQNNDMADRINSLLHAYSEMMIGRMGMPYKECGLYIINITLDGQEERIAKLSHDLSLLPGVSIKTTFAKGEF
ncbi:MAG: ATP-binding cassette domain-containing protein [Lachnospiraceae bacterium]|nr:ATP-binding cassette domain-containing protein [Lachnospiraceae bacterium]